MDKELLKGSTPIVVLSLLQTRPMYGYEMMKRIEALTNGVLAFKEGTLYPILHQLELLGYVHSTWSSESGERRRKYYAITDEGQAHLAAKRREWSQFRTAIDKVIGEEPV
ncbi:PadR family transcriptional regulator [Alicyclobacillus dauci]|uniref:PadR family transcriptional regulator n=1 Tax=Alicyclobacillus dauci TaxID=1475485 RepID=UPI0038992232